jgi:hemerythrin
MQKIKFLVWKQEYSVGIEHLDSQHQQIFAIINSLYEAITEGYASHMVSEVLSTMQDYTRLHFREEERLMKLYQYPDLMEHEKAHSYLIQKNDYLMGQYKSHPVDISRELFQLLKNWWTGHINGMDKKYSPYLAESKAPEEDVK